MSKQISQQKWAAIVYGRSYHLDFRFITIPNDFTAQEIAWASPYILATTQKARNIADSPRWSLFKNNSHCVVGVTCMVRDLIGKLGEDSIEVMAKDDLGRPLYVFVGYVTKLNHCQSLDCFPAYMGVNLASFKPLYREVERVWLLRDYDNRKPLLSEYKSFGNGMEIANSSFNVHYVSQVNNQKKHPSKIFVWQKSIKKDYQLWSGTAQCPEPTSICLNIKDKFLVNSPFLNQTVSNIEKFTIKSRISFNTNSIHCSPVIADKTNSKLSISSSSLKQKISTRAKEDIDLTIHHATKLTSSAQGVFNNLNPWSSSTQATDTSNQEREDKDGFGFKNKPESLSSKKQDWF